MSSHDRYGLFEVPNFGQDMIQEVGDTWGGGGKKERRDGDKRELRPTITPIIPSSFSYYLYASAALPTGLMATYSAT